MSVFFSPDVLDVYSVKWLNYCVSIDRACVLYYVMYSSALNE